MSDQCIVETPAPSYDDNFKILETKKYDLSFLNEEYELTINLYESFIDFKLIPLNIISPYCYQEKYDLSTINKHLFTFFTEIKKAFIYYDTVIKEKKIKLIQKNDIIILNTINIINYNEKVEANLELKKNELLKDDLIEILLNEVNKLKKIVNSKKEKEENELNIKNKKLMNENEKEQIKELKKEKDLELNKIKKENNNINIKEEINKLKNEMDFKIKEIEKKVEVLFKEYNNKLKGEKEEIEQLKKLDIEYNDNVNLINDFKCENIANIKTINTITTNATINWMKSVAVYTIIRNNEKKYELAYPEYNQRIFGSNEYNIIIYDILLNNISTKINYAHSDVIHRIKHYYSYYSKKHFLLSSSKDKSVKIWNISSIPISNELKIDNCFNGLNGSPFCMLFNKETYFILGGSYTKKKNIWNKYGILIGSIEKSNLNKGIYIESTFIDNKPYVLLSGENHSESLDYENNTLKIYKSNNKDNQHYISNLFNKNKILYLICGDKGGNVIIFDFLSANEIHSIYIGTEVNALCPLNEKYILVGNDDSEIKIIDYDSLSIFKKFVGHNKFTLGIEKIKIENEREFIISYDSNEIKLWQ